MSKGFTLVELTVVVFVVALLLGGILVPLSSQVEQRQFADARRQLEDIKEALVGYSVATGHLPCPDRAGGSGIGTPNDGQEDLTAGGFCESMEGNLPWVTLGVQATDPWGNRYRYRVTDDFASRAPAAIFDLPAQGDLQICATSACVATEMLSVAPSTLNSPVAVILSHGPNGWGAINSATNAPQLPSGCAAVTGCADISADEQANADDNAIFVSRDPSPPASTAGEFDDVVTWLSPHTLKARMVAAGKLP